MSPTSFIACTALSFVAGTFGGLAGVGGSMIILPGLHWILGSGGAKSEVHHLYMASAMCVNMVTAFVAQIKHKAAGAVRKDLLLRLALSAVVGVIIGVLISNQFQGVWLKWTLAVFMMGYVVLNIYKLVGRKVEPHLEHARVDTARLLAIGLTTGVVAGFLGLGGGLIMVPLLQVVCNVSLRHSIGTSSAAMWFIAMAASSLKLATLSEHGQSAWLALGLAGAMVPGAMIGARLGSHLTHSLPLVWVRGIITAILLVAALKLVGVW